MVDYSNLALALAGVCQSAKLVQQLAHQGSTSDQDLLVTLESLVVTQPQQTLDVYGGNLANIKLGLATLLEQLNGKHGPLDLELSRYWLSLLALEGKLNSNSDKKKQLVDRIQYLPTQLEFHDSLIDSSMLAILAGIYVDIISPLGAKIQVKGLPLYLQQPEIQNRIRACLLAGIRSAVLWRQVGGSKWKLLFFRSRLIQAAQQLYSSLR
ncbi:high frequency lysogenization protein HflD [Gallibacterium salpingitidis]|uniref:High frequency lysogenization protein HflD homolog n=1 Tax=Gallibacterium salpingitidis TaxID=505341 RepID=A0A1A7NN63_9PAST|nr:high frequency lysogenization protein HflD [Gallibacterium salpingitidis]OBW91053.1 lysogenization regulator [Gallibacterium salpingitidis]